MTTALPTMNTRRPATIHRAPRCSPQQALILANTLEASVVRRQLQVAYMIIIHLQSLLMFSVTGSFLRARSAPAFSRSGTPLSQPPAFNPIISLGPATDNALDELVLPDHYHHSLRTLVQTRSSRAWENCLQEMPFELNARQAQRLAAALISDLTPPPPTVPGYNGGWVSVGISNACRFVTRLCLYTSAICFVVLFSVLVVRNFPVDY